MLHRISYEVLPIYDVEKRFTVLENVVGFARLDIYTQSHKTQQHWGMFKHWAANFTFPKTPYESEFHQR